MQGNSAPIDAGTLEGLRGRVEGAVVGPNDEGYEAARTVWNAMVDRRPALVVRPTGVPDVVAAVGFARDHDLPVAVHAGGHNVAGNAVPEGGLMLECSSMATVEVDPTTRTARVGPGATVGDLDGATTPHGLVTPGGIVSTTGVAGLTLGGGWGWLSRSLGLAVDNLRSAELVTADGEVVRANEAQHPELFWGVRGGGGNLGVVTSFEFDLHEVAPRLLSGVLAYPVEAAGEVLRFHREFAADAPDELCCYASVRTAPDATFVPEHLRGEQIAAVYLCYAGDHAAGERVVAPLREFHPPVVDLVEPRPYVELQSLFDDVYPSGFRNYWKSGYLDGAGLSDAAIEALVEYAGTVTSPYTSIVIEHLGGAISRVDPDATAYAHREAAYAFNVFARWVDAAEDDRHVAWTREFFDAMAPHLADGVYVNFLGREGEGRVRSAYGQHYERLAALKTRWDPANRFSVNQNVKPA